MDARVCGAIVIVAAMTAPGVPAAQPKDAPKAADDKKQADPDEVEPDPPEGEPKTPPEAAPAGAATIVLAAPRFQWELFGYLRLQYVAVQNDPNIAFVGRGDGFALQNARIGVIGHLDRRAAFVVSFDGAVDEREQINVPDGKLRVGLRDAFADVALGSRLEQEPGVSDVPFNLAVRGGFFQTWAEPESLVLDTAREFIDRPIESRGIRATEGFQTQGLTPGRSLGVALRLDPAVSKAGLGAGFELAVQNGADEFASNNDNDKPAVSLAGLLRFANAGYLVLAGRYNPRSVGDLPFRQDENDLQGSAGVRFVAGPVSVAGAAVFVRTSFPTTGGPVQNSFGTHSQLMVRFGPDTMPFAVGYRFGILDPSSLIVTDRVMEHTAGLVLGVPRYRMRLQLQLTHSIEQGARELSNSRAQVAAEVAL